MPDVKFNSLPSYFNASNDPPDVRAESTPDLIRKIGEDSATLLKNTNGALPLKKLKRIAIVGNDAGPNALSTLNSGGSAAFPLDNENGTLTLGGGSGWVIAPYIVTPYEAINYRARKSGAQVYAMFDDTALDQVNVTVMKADVALVFVSAWASEGYDRANLRL